MSRLAWASWLRACSFGKAQGGSSPPAHTTAFRMAAQSAQRFWGARSAGWCVPPPVGIALAAGRLFGAAPCFGACGRLSPLARRSVPRWLVKGGACSDQAPTRVQGVPGYQSRHPVACPASAAAIVGGTPIRRAGALPAVLPLGTELRRHWVAKKNDRVHFQFAIFT